MLVKIIKNLKLFQILYELQSVGMVARSSENPPKWALISESSMVVEQAPENSSFVIPENIDELRTSKQNH